MISSDKNYIQLFFTVMHVIIAPKLSIRIKLMTTKTLLAMFVTIMMTLTEMVSLMSMTIVYLIPMLISWIQV